MPVIDELKILVTADTAKATEALNKTESQTGKTALSLAKMAAVGAAVGIAVKQIIDVSKQLYNEFANDELAAIRLGAALSNSDTMAKGAEDRFTAFAAALQKTTIYGDDVTRSQIAQLAALGKSEAEIKKIISAATDLASATGVDLDTAVKQLNATLQGNAGILGRQNAAVRALSEEELKSGKAIDVVAAQYAGFADKIGTGAYGSAVKFNNAMGDLRENIGGDIAQVFSPIINHLADLINKFNAATAASKEFYDFVKSGSTEGIDAQLALAEAMKQVEKAERDRIGLNSRLAGAGDEALKAARERVKVLGQAVYWQGLAAKGAEDQAAIDKKALEDRAKAIEKAKVAAELAKVAAEKAEDEFIAWGDDVLTTWGLLDSVNKPLDDISKKVEEIRRESDMLTSAWSDWTLQIGDTNIALDDAKNAASGIWDAASDAYSAYQDVVSAGHDAEIAALEAQMDLMEENGEDTTAIEKQIKDAKNKYAKEEFEANKLNSLAEATINGAMAAVKAYSTLGPVAGPIAAAVIAGLTATQLGLIGGQQYVPMAEGGFGTVTKPTLFLAGEAGAEDFAFGPKRKGGLSGGGTTIIQNIGGSIWSSRQLESMAVSAQAKASRGF